MTIHGRNVAVVLIVTCDDCSVPINGLVVVLRSGWTAEDMAAISSEYSGKRWGWTDEGDALPSSYRVYSVKNKPV